MSAINYKDNFVENFEAILASSTGERSIYQKALAHIKSEFDNFQITDDARAKFITSLMAEMTIAFTTKAMDAAGDVATKALTLEKELEAAKLESREDFLTKVATKRALMREIQCIEEAYKRYGTDYSICFVDIDFFKKINDTYGHEAGDVILSAVAQVLKKNARKVDFVGRYGGEEFVILLPSTSLKDGVRFGEKLRSMIENFKFIYKNERIKVTISSGVATRSANLSDTMTLEGADKMLYLSKEGGRNQVMPKIIEEK